MNDRKCTVSQNRVDVEMEGLVYDWAHHQFGIGKRVQTVDLCRFAKSVSKNPAFQGSSGWAANFLNRHPDLKQMVKNKNYKNSFMPMNELRGINAPNTISQKLSGRAPYPN